MYTGMFEEIMKAEKRQQEKPISRHFKFPFSTWMKGLAASLLIMGGLSYYLFFFVFQPGPHSDTAVKIIEKDNPFGVKTSFSLSDGTKVKLNSGSKLRLPETFTGATREVELIGEAFFEVKRDTAHPFIIKSGNISTLVLGTSFNIKAFPWENSIKVSVVTGEVRVENQTKNEAITLLPGEQAKFDTSSLSLKKGWFESDEISWIDGKIIFKAATFPQIIDKLEQWYGVEFILEREIKLKKGFTSEYQNESLDHLLEGLSFIGKFEFEIKDKKVYIR